MTKREIAAFNRELRRYLSGPPEPKVEKVRRPKQPAYLRLYLPEKRKPLPG